ncbi:unnamed protein product [Parajaminaea phylloscopi]
MKAAIPRTATFAWSPATLDEPSPYVASGTVAGALDESFSNESVLEIWQPEYSTSTSSTSASAASLEPIATAPTSAKLNRLAWGYVSKTSPRGLLAAGLENGELGVWDADKIIKGASDAQILKNSIHTGPVRGLDFNANQSNLLATGAVNGEIYIWDLTNPSKPYTPGAKSQKIDEVTSLAWNGQVPHILATASSSGCTAVWDLKAKRDIVGLTYGGGAGTASASASAINGAAAAAPIGRAAMSAIAWHPDNPTRLVTASDDDASPVVLLWDLRNARAPEKIFTGHDRGVLSVSWCKQDSDLVLSCGKDNRTLLWNPRTCDVVGELPRSNNWNFDVQWCPRNPNLIATASFEGQIGIHSAQATNQSEQEDAGVPAAAPAADGSDLFNSLSAAAQPQSRAATLTQPPKWLRRPISASFGFGGQIISVSSVAAKAGQPQPSSSTVLLRNVVTEPSIVARAQRLQEALDSQTLAEFCNERSKQAVQQRPGDVANWKALQTLFQADSRDELVALLGFSKEDVAARVSRAIAAYKTGGPSALAGLNSAPGTPSARQLSGSVIPSSATSEAGDDAAAAAAPAAHEPVVSFADEQQEQSAPPPPAADTLETAPSEVSTTVSSEPKATTEGGESEVTEPSLFSDDNGHRPGAGPASGDQSGVEFFNSISGESGAGVRSAVPERVLVPHMSFPPASSVAATAGSPGPSSVASVDLRPTTFRIYPSDESDVDKLITRALVLGDFESAVSVCISTDRFADALLLAVRGGAELLARTQKTYFERRTTSLPYLRVFQSIVSDDLTDIVQNADLNEWQEIFVVLCTFAKAEEFSSLAEQLGQRLEFQYVKSARAPGGAASADKAKAHRKNAILCYLAAGKLEKVAGMWIDEMNEEEETIRLSRKADGETNGIQSDEASATQSLYSAHAEALQTFIEKITVFQNAVKYVDADLQAPTTSQEVADTGARTYKLAGVYDRIHEYIELLADQGLIAPALRFVEQTPADYVASSLSSTSNGGTAGMGPHPARQRLLQASSARAGQAAATSRVQQRANTASRSAAAIPASTQYAPVAPTYEAYNGGSGPYGAPAQQPLQPQSQLQQQQPQQQAYGATAYAPSAPSVPSVPAAGVGYGPYGAPAAPLPAQAQQLGMQANPYGPSSIVPAPPVIQDSAYAPPQQAQSMAQPPPPPPPKRSDGGWNDVPELPNAPPKRTGSAMAGAKAAPIMSPFPNSPAATPMPYGQQGPHGSGSAMAPPPPRGGTPAGNQSQSFGRPPSAAAARLPPPPRSGSAAGVRGPPTSSGIVPPVPSVPSVPPPGSGPYGAPPGQHGQQGQHGHPLPPQQQQQQQQQMRQQPGPGPYGPPPQGQQQPHHPQQHPPQQPGQFPAGAPLGPPGAMRPPGPPGMINRSQTPGAGAGPPRSHTPSGARPGPSGASQFKHPPGDRTHIPEAQRGIFQILSRELQRIKAQTPPAQKRMVDDAERRLNILFDYLNNGLLDAKAVSGLQALTQAVDARNQQAALGIHVQLVTSASGDFAQALVGIKFVLTRL